MYRRFPSSECASLCIFRWLGAYVRFLSIAAEAWITLFSLSLWLLLVPPCKGGSGVFENTGSLNTGRYLHTATLLPDGKVLVAAGRTGFPSGGIIASAELYDSASGTWTDTGSLAAGRQQHTATLLPNGKVLVAGGIGNSGDLASAELYDPASGTWTATGSLATARANHTATLLPDGKVLVAGDYVYSNGASAELYDPANGTWTHTSSMGSARSGHTATLLPNGKVLVAGGVGNGPTSAELYDPTSGTWQPTGNLITEQSQHTATLLPNNTVLIVGFSFVSPVDTELYDPVSGTWSATETLFPPRTYGHTATLLPNGKVLVVAGEFNGSVLGDAQLYEPACETWIAGGNLAPPGVGRTDHTATLLPNGKVLIAGGAVGPNIPALSSAELYIGSTPTPTLRNLSTRLAVGTAAMGRALIAGFIVQGNVYKRVLIRGTGPSLANLGVPNVLVNPQLTLNDSRQLIIGRNDDWRTTQIGGVIGSNQVAEIQNSGLAPSDPLESAIIATLPPGNYTAILQGASNDTGVGIVEVYELRATPPNSSFLGNISTRGFVQTGDNVMIGGFIVVCQPTRVLIRAIGPSLTQFGVPDALGNPQLELHDATSLIGRNDDWQTTQIGGIITSDQVAEIQNSQLAPTNPAESAIIATLQPGSYTAIVRGVNNTTGNALVEVYALP